MPDTNSVTTYAEFIGRLSSATLLAIALIAFQQGWVVTGSQYNDLKADRDEWKSLTLKATNLAESTNPKVRISGPITGRTDTIEAIKTRLERIENR